MYIFAFLPLTFLVVSNYNFWQTKHTIADLAIDFKKQRLQGIVTLELESISDKGSDKIILDTSFLDLTDIKIDGTTAKTWEVKERSEPYGSPLHISIPGGAAKGSKTSITIVS